MWRTNSIFDIWIVLCWIKTAAVRYPSTMSSIDCTDEMVENQRIIIKWQTKGRSTQGRQRGSKTLMKRVVGGTDSNNYE